MGYLLAILSALPSLVLATDLPALLDIYNPYRLAALWDYTRNDTSCLQDTAVYLKALSADEFWAHHAADASGRYDGGFLWGNRFWTGSSAHCRNILPSPPIGLDLFVFRAKIRLYHFDIPPLVASELFDKTENARTTILGVCLPFSCSADEAIQVLLRGIESAKLQDERSVSLTTVKDPHDSYRLIQDPLFWALIIALLVTLMLAILGTVIELYDDNNLKKRARTKYAYDKYRYEIAESPEVITESIKIQAGPDSNGISIWKELLLSFSFKRNIAIICQRSVGEDTIPTIHGLRAFSMAWVILGHTCVATLHYSDNLSYRSIVEKEFFFQTINNASYSVDTFFFMSGLLVSYLYFRTTSKHDITKITGATGIKSNFLEFIGLIFYRFARLTTPYIFTLGCYLVVMQWFYHHSVFEPPMQEHITCAKYWWRNILYINSYFPFEDMCMLWSWYLSDDTQFYIVGVILLMLAVKYLRAAAVLMAIFLVCSWCTTGLIAYSTNYVPNDGNPFNVFDKIYDKPWTRLGPYLVGMSAGWLLFKTDCKIKMNKRFVMIGWTLTISLFLFLVYGIFGIKLQPIAAAIYTALSHTAWAIGLAWVVIACSTGYGGYISDILSSNLLYPFSRVTYCAYLVHSIVIAVLMMRMESPIRLGPEIMTLIYPGLLCLSYITGFILSLLFEAPVVSFLRIISPAKRKST